MDGTGLEPVAPTMSKWCATNCANRPWSIIVTSDPLIKPTGTPVVNGLEKDRRRPDSNWGIEDLQSSALPLGHAAENLLGVEPKSLNRSKRAVEVYPMTFSWRLSNLRASGAAKLMTTVPQGLSGRIVTTTTAWK